MIEIVWMRRLVLCLLVDWISRDVNRFSGIEILNWRRFDSSPSIYKLAGSFGWKVNTAISSEKILYSSIVTLFGRHVSFSLLHQMEKGKGKEEYGGWASVVGEPAWHNMSVIVMSMSQHINCCERAPSPRVIACWRVSIGANNTVLSHPKPCSRDTYLDTCPNFFNRMVSISPRIWFWFVIIYIMLYWIWILRLRVSPGLDRGTDTSVLSDLTFLIIRFDWF